MVNIRLSLGLLLLAPLSAFGQEPKEMKVAAATRLDWEFAASGFGAKAATLPKGYDSTKQRYQLFVPKTYNAKQGWPLVVFISPGDQPAGWSAWKKVCEKEGVLFCSPFAAGNNVPAGQRTRIVLDMLDDVRRQYRIDPDQTYISGFSGGGRMACAIGFALPEWFGGVAPVCGTNPITGPAFLRHRIEDRLSVAFITGATDFNRKENEVYMFPWFEELKIRSKLWVAPKVGHNIPGGDVFVEVYDWLKADLKRRQEDRKSRPVLAMTAGDTPTGAQQAARHVEAAEAELKIPERTWRGVTLLQGVTARWPKTESSAKARQVLKGLLDDEKLVGRIAEQGAADEIRSVSAQARAFERFGKLPQAIQAWEIIVRNHGDTAAGRKAVEEIKRLKKDSSK
jgi:hypothetical protein